MKVHWLKYLKNQIVSPPARLSHKWGKVTKVHPTRHAKDPHQASLMTPVEKWFLPFLTWQKSPGGESDWPKFGCEPVSNARGQNIGQSPLNTSMELVPHIKAGFCYENKGKCCWAAHNNRFPYISLWIVQHPPTVCVCVCTFEKKKTT